MNDIVEDALEHAAARRERQPSDGQEVDGFGPPTFAVIGCGRAGIGRVTDIPETGVRSDGVSERVPFDVTTIGVGTAEEIESAAMDRTVSLGDDESESEWPQMSGATDAALESLLAQNDVRWDVAVVTAHGSDSRALESAATACRVLPPSTTTIGVITVPADGLTVTASDAVRELVDAAGLTLPVDLARLDDAFPDATDRAEDHRLRTRSLRATFPPVEEIVPWVTEENPSTRLELANGLVVELLSDLFEAFQLPLAVPLPKRDLFALFDSGGVALVHWGWAVRSDLPDGLLAHAVANRFCDGDADTADGGFAFLRFGSTFTLRQFETVRNRLRTDVRPPDVERGRWLVAGNVTPGLGDECRLALLLTGIVVESLPFLGDV